MKRIFIMFTCLFCVCFSYAKQTKITIEPKLIEKYYGEIVVDMTNSAWLCLNPKDSATVNKITYERLNKIINESPSIIREIFKDFKLDRNNFTSCNFDTKLLGLKFEESLIKTFPGKTDSLLNVFEKHIDDCNFLTKEIHAFNTDTTANKSQYASVYPNGRFISIIHENNEEGCFLGHFGWIYIVICVILIVAIIVITCKKTKRKYIFFGKRTDIDQEVPEADDTEEENTENKEKDKKGKDGENKDLPQKTPEVVDINTIDKLEQEYKLDKSENTFVKSIDDIFIAGASVMGNSHISSNIPCQDSCCYENLGNGWGIAISSDGAGSAKNSKVGSEITSQRALVHFTELVKNNHWIENKVLPTEMEWNELAFNTLRKVRNEIYTFSQKKNVEFNSLSATLILVVHSPYGLLVTHVGDGRAGYMTPAGKWKSMITPHDGEEVNQTIFMTSAFWDIPYYRMSGVLVPESRVIKEKYNAFTLMSDGCQNTAWEWNFQNKETKKFYDPNLPHADFFNPLVNELKKYKSSNRNLEEISMKWYGFVKEGQKSFIRETDDKTLILAVIQNNK